VPLDICQGFGAALERHAATTTIDDKAANYEEKWAGYEQLVDYFCDLAKRMCLYGRNDYYLQTAGIQQLVQLVDTQRSLGCRAEALYAERQRRIKVLTLELCADGLESGLRDQVGDLAMRGAQIGEPRHTTRLVSAA
jgi:hypothetical protein